MQGLLSKGILSLGLTTHYYPTPLTHLQKLFHRHTKLKTKSWKGHRVVLIMVQYKWAENTSVNSQQWWYSLVSQIELDLLVCKCNKPCTNSSHDQEQKRKYQHIHHLHTPIQPWAAEHSTVMWSQLTQYIQLQATDEWQPFALSKGTLMHCTCIALMLYIQ